MNDLNKTQINSLILTSYKIYSLTKYGVLDINKGFWFKCLRVSHWRLNNESSKMPNASMAQNSSDGGEEPGGGLFFIQT